MTDLERLVKWLRFCEAPYADILDAHLKEDAERTEQYTGWLANKAAELAELREKHGPGRCVPSKAKTNDLWGEQLTEEKP